MPSIKYGAYAFTFSGGTNFSGWAPKTLEGPNRQMYVPEHQIPAREGGIVEYIGSEQSKYQFKGFISPSMDGGTTAALVLSGNSYLAVNADDAKDFIKAMRGSGAQLLKIESTFSNMSGYQSLYENGFFQIEKMTLAFEAGHTYPYYPYSIDFRGVTPTTYGDSSGLAGTFLPDAANLVTGVQSGDYYSGYIFLWALKSGIGFAGGMPNGETINSLGIYVLSVASGNLKVAVYSGASVSSGSNTLTAQSAPQAVHSGWNYFPLRPSFLSVSGATYLLAWAGDATKSSGFVVAYNNASGNQNPSAVESGIGFASAFPVTFTSLSGGLTANHPTGNVMVVGL